VFLLGHGPEGAPAIDPNEERRARQEDRAISPEQISRLTVKYLERIAYKTNFCRYHSFVVYFSNLQRLSWVEFTGREEPSEFQEH